MGYYLECPVLHNKAQWLKDNYSAVVCQPPGSFDQLPDDVALVVTVDNGAFEAAGYAYSEREFDAFVNGSPGDMRPRTFLLMDKATVELLSGYNRPPGTFPDYTIKNPVEVKEAVAQERRNATPKA